MISLRVGLMPKKNHRIKENYEGELKSLCKRYIKQNRFEHILNSESHISSRSTFSVDSDIKISPLQCSDYKREGNDIVFNDKVNWYINSHSYELILHIAQGIFKESVICINNAEFDVLSIETFDGSEAV